MLHIERMENFRYNPVLSTGETAMSDIVKICSIHGPLTIDQIYGVISKRECRACKSERAKLWHKAKYERLAATPGALEEFRKRKKDQNYKSRDKHFEDYTKQQKASQEKRKRSGKIYESQIKRLYGVTQEEYQVLFNAQNGLCEICNEPETRKSRTPGFICRLAIDHCHNSGKIRGLLCHSCNTAIGKFKDNTEILRKAIEYLERDA